MAAAELPPLAAEAVPVPLELELDPPQASRITAPIPAAAPVRAVRRVSCRILLKGVSSSLRSSHSSRSRASWTTSSSLDTLLLSSPQDPDPATVSDLGPVVH